MKRRRATSAAALPVALGMLVGTPIAVTAPIGAAQAPAPAAPRGPADIISGARKARQAREMQQAIGSSGASEASGEGEAQAVRAAQAAQAAKTAPAGEASAAAIAEPKSDEEAGTAAPAAAENPHVQNPHAQNPHGGTADPRARALTEARVDSSLPNGSVRVRVLDERDQPVAGAEVELGVMGPDGSREHIKKQSDRDGYARFEGLEAGERKAYRANVPYSGAKYSSTPFRLPPRGGYDVTVRRLPVTRDDAMVVLYTGATSVELKDERLKIVQQVRLYNIGAETYVFPEDGQLLRLPEGFLAVQAQESMTDQKVVEAPDEGLRITGSVPPGDATMLWGFDLPIEGTEQQFSIPVPWKTFAYRVVADAPEGLTIDVDGFPAPSIEQDAGRRFWVTELRRKIGDTPFSELRITVRGIPGPGPARWIAAALSLCAIAIGIAFAYRKREQAPGAERAFEQRKAELVARAESLDAQLASGDIGPEYHREQVEALTDELAALLFEEERRTKLAEQASAKPAATGQRTPKRA